MEETIYDPMHSAVPYHRLTHKSESFCNPDMTKNRWRHKWCFDKVRTYE